jgi:hypothetical protein
VHPAWVFFHLQTTEDEVTTKEYFVNEVHTLQRAFNETFGALTCSNVDYRLSVIMAVIGLSLMARDIGEEEDEIKRRRLIKEFMRRKTIIRQTFQQVKQQQPASKRASSFQRRTAF